MFLGSLCDPPKGTGVGIIAPQFQDQRGRLEVEGAESSVCDPCSWEFSGPTSVSHQADLEDER